MSGFTTSRFAAWSCHCMTLNDIELARSAEADDGIATRKNLRAAGYAEHIIDRKIVAGLLVPLFPGIYRVAGHPETWLGNLRAAFYWAGDGALITGASALALRGLDGFKSPEPDIYMTGSKTHDGVRTRRLYGSRFARRPSNGMWTTTIEHELLDACATHPAVTVGLAMDDTTSSLDRTKSSGISERHSVLLCRSSLGYRGCIGKES